MVLAGVATDYLYEKCRIKRSIFYPGHSSGIIINILNPGNVSKSCLEAKENSNRGNEMKMGGWIFLVSSWGIILGLTIFCFIKVFSKKELK